MGTAAQLSQSEIDALRAKLMALWNPPIGMQDANNTQVTIRIRFKRDGTLAAGPQVLTSGNGVQFDAMRDSAVRAVFVGAALHHAAPGSLRHLEGNRFHLRHQTDVSRHSRKVTTIL